MTVRELWKRLALLERNISELRQMFQNIPARAGKMFLGALAGVGKLDESLSANGDAAMSVYMPGLTGGIGTDTGATVTVIDAGLLSETLPINTPVVWVNIFGRKVVVAYKCL